MKALCRWVQRFWQDQRGALEDPGKYVGYAIVVVVMAALVAPIISSLVTATTTAGADSFTGFLPIIRLWPLAVAAGGIGIVFALWQARRGRERGM